MPGSDTKWSKDYQEMVRVVLEVFDAYPAETLDGIWAACTIIIDRC